jgi:RNA polymerase sigma-70 factor (family 1)
MRKEISLIDDFRAGDYNAFSQIMNRHIHALTFFSYKYCKNKQVAEEIVADTFTKLWNRKENFDSENSIKSFLYIASKNACLDFLKSAASKKSKQNVLLEDIYLSNDSDVLSNIIYSEFIQELYKEINKLPKRQSEIFILSFLEGYTTEEICSKLNISPNALYIAKKKASDALKQILSDKLLLTFKMLYFIYINK